MKPKYVISKTLSGVISLLFVTGAAYAGDFSVGLAATHAPVSVEEAGKDAGGGADGWRIHGQYMINETWGIEGGLSKYGTPKDNSIPSNMHVDTEAYDLYAVYAYPVGDNMGLIAKAGFISWDTETEVFDTNESHQTSTDHNILFISRLLILQLPPVEI